MNKQKDAKRNPVMWFVDHFLVQFSLLLKLWSTLTLSPFFFSFFFSVLFFFFVVGAYFFT